MKRIVPVIVMDAKLKVERDNLFYFIIFIITHYPKKITFSVKQL